VLEHGAFLVAITSCSPSQCDIDIRKIGHSTVAAVAVRFLKSETAQWVQAILDADPENQKALASGEYTGPVVKLPQIASWPDVFRYSPEGDFSYRYHFIDAEDHPPKECNLDMERDCKNGCIVTAM